MKLRDVIINMSTNTTDVLGSPVTYYVKLHQNSRKNLRITINKNNLSNESQKNPSIEFEELIKHTITTVKKTNVHQMIYVGHSFEYTPETILCNLTFFEIPTDLINQLDFHFKKNGTIRFIKFCIGKQWMEKDTKIALSVLNGIPNITDLAIINTTGKCTPYCSNTYDLQNPEW